MSVSCPKSHQCPGYYRLGQVPHCTLSEASSTIPQRFTQAAMQSTGQGLGGFLGALAIGVGHGLGNSSDATAYLVWRCDYCGSEVLYQIIINDNQVIGHPQMVLTA